MQKCSINSEIKKTVILFLHGFREAYNCHSLLNQTMCLGAPKTIVLSTTAYVCNG